MSLDSIVKISIEAKSISMSQKGFGIPLILAFNSDDGAAKVELYRNAGELPVNSKVTAYEMANIIFAQSPSVSLVKIGFARKGSSLKDALVAICNLDRDFYGLLLADDPKIAELKELEAHLESHRLFLGLDVSKTNDAEIKKLKSDRIFTIYNPQPGQQFAGAWMGKMLPVAAGSSSWAYRELKKVNSYTVSAVSENELIEQKTNRYIQIKGVDVILDGRATSGRFIDITHGIDWLHARMQERLFRLLG